MSSSIHIAVVKGSSMCPILQNNDVLLIKVKQYYKTGDIISFYSSEGILVTHRIVQVSPIIITKGDNVSKNDEPFETGDILGRVECVFRSKNKISLNTSLPILEFIYRKFYKIKNNLLILFF